MSDKLPEECPVCGEKMQKGYVSASPDIYWSEKKGYVEIVENTMEVSFGRTFCNVDAASQR